MPDTLIDGGSEGWAALRTAVERSLSRMARGQVLQVAVSHPDARFDVPAWCRETGHQLIATVTNTTESLFWIRKVADH
jgi:TusA-related sulfurtransferase